MRSLFAVCFVLSLLAPAASHALVIDNFEEGAFDLTAVGGSSPGNVVYDETGGLSTANVIGGVRLVQINASASDPGTANVNLSLGAGDDGAVLTNGDTQPTSLYFAYDGFDDGFVDGSTSPLNTDFTAAGDRIRVTLTAASASGSLDVVIHSNFVPTGTLPVAITGPGDYFFAFSDFGNPSLLDDVDIVLVRLNGITSNTGYTISNIEVVPEPCTALLAAIGLAGLAVRRRRLP